MEYYVVEVMDSNGNLLVHREFSTLFDSQIYADILTEIISCAESCKAKELNSVCPSVLRFREIKSKYFIFEKVYKS
jgi:ADP-dependent phosphofructokinase/glucokinase